MWCAREFLKPRHSVRRMPQNLSALQPAANVRAATGEASGGAFTAAIEWCQTSVDGMRTIPRLQRAAREGVGGGCGWKMRVVRSKRRLLLGAAGKQTPAAGRSTSASS